MKRSDFAKAAIERLDEEITAGTELLNRMRDVTDDPTQSELDDWCESAAFAIWFISDGTYIQELERLHYSPATMSRIRINEDIECAAMADIYSHLQLLNTCKDFYCSTPDIVAVHFTFYDALARNSGWLSMREAAILLSRSRFACLDTMLSVMTNRNIVNVDYAKEEICLSSNGWRVLRYLGRGSPMIPIEIEESLKRFHADHPDSKKAAFVMMRFGRTKPHSQLLEAIQQVLSSRGIACLRADTKAYHDDLYYNLITYMHGCGFGLAVFERIDADEFNPNVSLEVGYMLALGKNVCYLKDSTLKALHSDLIGKLYRPFDIFNLKKSIGHELGTWLDEKQYK